MSINVIIIHYLHSSRFIHLGYLIHSTSVVRRPTLPESIITFVRIAHVFASQPPVTSNANSIEAEALVSRRCRWYCPHVCGNLYDLSNHDQLISQILGEQFGPDLATALDIFNFFLSILKNPEKRLHEFSQVSYAFHSSENNEKGTYVGV